MHNRRPPTASALTLAIGALALGGCGGGTKFNDSLGAAAVASYSALSYGGYDEAAARATNLRTALAALVSTPSAETLASARAAWMQSRPSYMKTEATRFYDGPIDGPPNGPEGNINAWPLDENYIDYTVTQPDAGIINMPSITISKEMLKSLNTQGGEANISDGYHAIEFLLWGQDLAATGPGDRPFTDYVVGTGKNADRRGQYLLTVADLLVDDLTYVRDQWAPGQPNNYAAAFAARPAKEAITLALKGLGSLATGELAGQRMFVAYNEKDQEQEHSCFSDNTIRDLTDDARGIQAYWATLQPLVLAADPALATMLDAQTAEAVIAIGAIPPPFDQAILGDDNTPGRVGVKNAIDKVKAVADSLAKVGPALGLQVNFE